MPIFISYSHSDKAFVDKLAMNLVKEKHHIWLDRWELNVGDSLLAKIQEVLTGTSAILVILSTNSVKSSWCNKEINAGLVRELEERKTIVLPCVIDDCTIPLFLRDKFYADFRRDPDEAFASVQRALAGVSNPLQARSETPEFITDWSVDWGTTQGHHRIKWTFLDHGGDWPYVVLSECTVVCLSRSSNQAVRLAIRSGRHAAAFSSILKKIIESLDRGRLWVTIDDPKQIDIPLNISENGSPEYSILFSFRRMGRDNGMATILYMENNLNAALRHMEEATWGGHQT